MKTIFIDRDNTLNYDPGYLNDPNQLHLKRGVVEGLTLLKLSGFEFIVITNQSGISRELITISELEAVHQRLFDILQEHRISLKKIYYCPDQDDSSPCRKPNPQMIYDALQAFPIDLEHSYIIGDRYCDILTGNHFDIPGILIREDEVEEGIPPTNLIKITDNFLSAAQYVLQDEYEKLWKHKIFYETGDNFSKKIQELKQKQRKIVFTNGCFDLWHSGHLQYLAQSAALGDDFVIGINSDASVKKLKGVGRPILPVEERALKLAHLSFVDIVVVFKERTPIETIQKIEPDIHVKGGDYKKEELPEFSFLNKIGAHIIILPFKDELSTSSIVKKIQNLS